MSASFFSLTPDWVLRAVEASGLRPTGHVTALVCLENRVYDLRLEDDSHVVAKFYRPGRWSREAVEEEHLFLEDLRAAEIPVCVPLPFADGRTVHAVEDILYAVWPRTGGRSPDELADEALPVLGRLLARIHNVGATRDAPHRPRLGPGSAVLEPLEVLLEGGFVPRAWQRSYREAAEQVAALTRRALEGVPHHRIHADCHRGNLLRGDAGWFFLDFDDCAVGPAMQDVWMLVPGRDAEAERQRARLLDAYREFREFDPRWLELVEPLRGCRFVRYAAWIARRWEDPAFRSTFPHFGSDEYWERETRDLAHQVERVERGAAPEPGGERPAAEPERELTNEDFFWDL